MVASRAPGGIEAVVLDLDDTLFDHTGSTLRALEAWLGTMGVTSTTERTSAWFVVEARHFESWRAGRISFAEQRRRRLRDFLPSLGRPAGGDAELDAVFADYLRCYEDSWQAFDDAQPALDELARAGLTLAVLTNGTVEQQQAKVQRIGVAPYLAALVTSEELGVAKPSPRAYLAACERLGSPPHRTLHVGDRHDLDVVAARAAGLAALHLDRHGRDDEPAEGRLRSLRELAPRLASPKRGEDGRAR